MIKIGSTGWGIYISSLDVRKWGGISPSCALYSKEEDLDYDYVVKAQSKHADACFKTFCPHNGKRGILFFGGHNPLKYGMEITASYGGIYFVEDDDPRKWNNPLRDIMGLGRAAPFIPPEIFHKIMDE